MFGRPTRLVLVARGLAPLATLAVLARCGAGESGEPHAGHASDAAAHGDDGADLGHGQSRGPARQAFVPTAHAQLPARYGLPAVRVVPEAAAVCGRATVRVPESTRIIDEIVAATGLSRAYTGACAGCHGYAGEGRPGFPPLTSAESQASFARVVREGRNGMPAFAPALYDDATLAADRARLASLAGMAVTAASSVPAGFRDVPLPEVTPISEAEHAAILNTALPVYREPGRSGSCAGCHAPDGIDLARIGYSRPDIVRRAVGQGRTAAEGMLLADMVEAQRRRHGITAPCSPSLFRPLQPTGMVAQAPDPASADAALLEQLGRAGIWSEEWLTKPPADAAAAQAWTSAVLALDVRAVPIAVPLSRWTSDAIHGPADRTTSEWIPEIALEPGDAETDRHVTSLTNRYLEQPTDANLWALYDEVEHLDAGRFVPAEGFAERLSREKFRAVLLMQHSMRRGDLVPASLAGVRDFHRFPVWETAQVARVMTRGCAETDAMGPILPCWRYPDSFFAKMGRDRGELIADVGSIGAPWFIAGLILEPSLQLTEKGDARMTHLHAALLEAAGIRDEGWRPALLLPVHHLYFGLLRLVHGIDGLDPAQPAELSYRRPARNGCWARPSLALAEWDSGALDALERLGVTAEDTSAPPRRRAPLQLEHAARAAGVAEAWSRAILLRIQAALDRPSPGCADQPPDQGQRLATIVRAIGAFGRPDSAVAAGNRALSERIAARVP